MEFIVFTNKKSTTSDIASIHIGDTEVLGKDQVKLFGITLDKRLTLKVYVHTGIKIYYIISA